MSDGFNNTYEASDISPIATDMIVTGGVEVLNYITLIVLVLIISVGATKISGIKKSM